MDYHVTEIGKEAVDVFLKEYPFNVTKYPDYANISLKQTSLKANEPYCSKPHSKA